MTRPYLGNPKYTIEVLQKYGFVFQKRFGQNFLIDTRVLDRIIEASEITKDDFVLEIGPGIGTMTQYLADAAREVTAVEIDDALIPILQDTLKEWDNVSVIHGDILKTDIRKIADEKNQGRPIKVVANLPYYITTPIIMGLFESHVPVDSITVMVQKEVADRMQTGPGSKDYGALSLAVQYYAKPEIVANVPPNCFMPRPKVGSAVIRLTRHQNPPVQAKDEKLMFRIIRASFNQRRKTLANGLKNSQELNYTKEQVDQKVLELMELVGISHPKERYHQYPWQFSGGMRQRCVMAIALAADPDILFADEPTTALDVTIQAQILDLLREVQQKLSMATVFVTHDLGVVAHVADRVAVMYAGKIVEVGTAREIFYSPAHPYTWALLSSMPDLETKERLFSIPGTPPNMIFPPKGDAFAERNQYAMQVDFEEEPPFFKLSDTHYAATWLLHPNAPKVEMPEALQHRIARMNRKEGV